MLWKPIPDERWAEREDDVLSYKLSNQRHAGIVGCFFDIVQHRVDVIELTKEVGKFGHWQLFYDIVLDQFN